jgi:hypothetical protein
MPKIFSFKKDSALNFLTVLVLILVGAGLRLVPHPPNFTPIAAIALLGGVYLSKRAAFAIPMIAMMVSDIFIGYYSFSLMVFVYGSFFLCVFLGSWLKKQSKWTIISCGSVLCSVLFFVVTNFGVWAVTPWYEKTIPGLMQCYFMALPFFKNSLLGDLFYTTAFFGAFGMAKSLVRIFADRFFREHLDYNQ